jgi:hypothetical protein
VLRGIRGVRLRIVGQVAGEVRELVRRLSTTIVEQHGCGTIGFESVPNVPTTFWFALALARDEARTRRTHCPAV